MAKFQLSDLDFNNQSKILNLPAPTSPNEPARLADLNSAIEGLSWKDSARVATTVNINLLNPGTSIFDGITVSVGDRVLVKDQSVLSENGIYVFNGPSSPLTRSLDANTFPELEQATLTVEEGTANGGTTYRQTAVNGTIGTSSVTFVTFGTAAPTATETTAGVVRYATQAEVDAGTAADRVISPLTLSNWSGRTRKSLGNLGDGTNTSFTLTHNFNTRDVMVTVYRNSGNYDEVGVDIERPTVNTVVVRFAVAPAANAFRVVIQN